MIRVERNEKGSAVVEFALALPLLMMIIFGAVEFGLGLHRQQVITDAAREGARFGIIMSTPRPSASEIAGIVNNYLSTAGWDPNQATVTVTGAGGASGNDLTVRVEYPSSFAMLSALVPGIPATITLRSVTVMKLE
jgi:Flp pilus assembly protein TadG